MPVTRSRSSVETSVCVVRPNRQESGRRPVREDVAVEHEATEFGMLDGDGNGAHLSRVASAVSPISTRRAAGSVDFAALSGALLLKRRLVYPSKDVIKPPAI